MYNYKKIEKDLLKLGVYPKGFWNPLYINLENNDLTMLLSERSLGKTTGILIYGIRMNVEYGVIIQYIREDRRHLNRTYVKDLFQTIIDCGYVEKLTNGKWNHIVYNAMQRKWYYANIDDTGEVIEVESNHFMIGLSCDMSTSLKSSYVCNKGDFIILDEFCSQSQYNYFEDFYNIISTIVRERETAKIILLSNTIDRTHWIFDEFPTREIIDTISEGQVVKFVTDEGMKFYIEFCYHAETRERKKFVNSHIFGFKNPKLTAIKGGGWNMKLYPHIQRGEKKETLLTNIALETTSGALSLDVCLIKNNLLIFCHKRTKIYDDTIIYSNNLSVNNVTNHNVRFGFGNGTKFDNFIWSMIKNNRVIYGSNRDGLLLDAYIKKTKIERKII